MIEMVVAFLFGLLIGSFLNVCVYRMPRDLSVVRPRSYCPECEKTIAWYDNIPVLSYLLLAGKCRHCGARISVRYPLLELLTGLAFVGVVWRFGVSGAAIKFAILSAILLELLFSDLDSRILPDEFTIGGIILGLSLAIWVPMDQGLAYIWLYRAADPRLISLAEAALGAAVASGALWLVGWLYQKVRDREGLGFGDVKMIAMMGAFFGLQRTLLVLVLGSVVGTVIGLGFILLARKDAATYELPYGTFLAAAALGYIFFS
jgi:leader peptidase (prepilin peptidase)/N-methyltransferase